MHPGSRVPDEVLAVDLSIEGDLFAELSAATRWEDVGKGRRGAVLTRVDEAGGVPLVRTTTRYGSPAQRFRGVHERLAERVRERVGSPVGFNNALIECYTGAYRRMGAHSDQALDLDGDSFIAVFSCYRDPRVGSLRKLIFEPKGPGEETFETPLAHNSIVAFSVESNRRLRHKIVLDASGEVADNEWLGVTFRTSKTLVQYRDGHAYLPDGERLVPADEEQQSEFYGLRRRENQETDFVYPAVAYTISASDLMPPV